MIYERDRQGIFVPRPAGRAIFLALVLASVFAVLGVAPAALAAPADPRLFPQTGYRVGDDAIWSYFQRRGGVDTFGYPVSREFTLLGRPVQVFQRGLLETQDDGSVKIVSLLDGGLIPGVHANGSTFPESDPSLGMLAPRPDQPNYGIRLGEFLHAAVPDLWMDQPVAFYSTFTGTVTCAEAYPSGGCNSGLLPLLNLEVWGMPTSQPTFDPHNHNLIYQRFERGILMYDAGCRCTQPVLLGDLFKSVLTGRDLPDDLAADAAGSAFLRQYDPNQPASLARPAQLPNTDLTDAFTPDAEPAP